MKILSYLIIIFLPLVLILANFRFLIFNQSFYKSEFLKLNVYQNFQSPKEADIHSNELINYLCCRGELEGDFFTQREKLHLEDVKNLIQLVNLQFFAGLAIIIVILGILLQQKKFDILLFSLRIASFTVIVAIFFLWATTFFNFEPAFVKFHQVSFNNDLWQLPPEANLIKLFPEQFFVDFANRVAFQTIAAASVIFILSYSVRRKVATKRN